MTRKGYRIFCYADDSMILLYGNTIDEIKNKIINAIAEFDAAIAPTGLKCNRSKTELIVFNKGGARNVKPPQISINLEGGDILNSAEFIKYLRLIIDNQLQWKTHIEKTSQKALILWRKLQGAIKDTYGYSCQAKKIMLNGTMNAIMSYGSPAFAHRLEANRHY